MGWVTVMFAGTVVSLLVVALAVDVWDRRNGRDPRRRSEFLQSRTDQRRRARIDLRVQRRGGRGFEDQFRAPPDDHDIRPDRRRRA